MSFLRSAVLFWALIPGALVHAADPVQSFNPEQSRIEVMVRSTLNSFVGRLEHYEAKVVFGEDGRIRAVDVHFRFTDFHTGWERRDRAMYDWAQSSYFPEGEYVLQAIVTSDDGNLHAHGHLRFHGRTRELVFPVSILTDHALWSIDGETPLDVRDFDLPPPHVWGFLKVDPVVRVRFHLQGTKL